MKPIKKAFSWLKKTIGIGFGIIRNHEFISVETTEHLKNLVRSPMVTGAVRLTPTKFDDRIHQALDKIVIPILQEVAIIHNIIKEYEKNSVAVDMILERMSKVNSDVEASIYQSFAARLNHRLADGVITLKEAWEQAQDVYVTFYKGK